MFRKLFLKYNNMSIRNKIVFFFCILLIIPTIIIGTVTYNYIVALIQKKAIDYTNEIQYLIIEKTDSYLAQLDSFLLNIAYETESIRKIGNTQINMNEFDAGDKNRQLQYMKEADEVHNSLFAKIQKNKYISSISLYTEKRNILAYKTVYNVNNSYSPGEDEWFEKAKATKRGMILSRAHFDKQLIESDNRIITLARKIYNPQDYSEIGIMALNINLDVMNDLCRDILKNEGVKVYITDSDGFINYCNDSSMIMRNVDDRIFANMASPKGNFIFTENGRKMFATYNTSDYTGWKIMFTIPYSNLIMEGNIVGLVILVVVLFLCIFLIFQIVYFSNRIARPIKNLELGMSTAIQNNFSNKIEVASNDEVGKLGSNFNIMLTKINELIADVYTEQRLKKEAEINALQAQINPHFLYNTLNTIRLMAVIQKADKIAQLISSLVNLLQFTAKKAGEFITIRDEIAALKEYVEIQKARYYNKFKVTYEIDEEVQDYKTLKFTLQPIVENAIFHGLEPKGGRGVIHVKISKEKEEIVFMIKDDGVGMDEETQKCLLTVESNDKFRFNKIGISNVHQRIRLYFGDGYGLDIRSTAGEGTEVRIVLPIII